jgi:hypothetical protein
MFSKLDTSADLFLDQMELAAINLDKYEVCVRPFFNSCDTYKDGRVSTAEWCFCFWRESECGPPGTGSIPAPGSLWSLCISLLAICSGSGPLPPLLPTAFSQDLPFTAQGSQHFLKCLCSSSSLYTFGGFL